MDLGVRTDHMLGFYLDSPAAPSNRKQINSYYRNMLARIEAVPGVTSVAALSHLPLDSLHLATRFSIAGIPEYGSASSGPSADIQTATPDYFRTFGVRMIRGREFSDADDETGAKVAMVNEAFAARFLTSLDPLNQRILMDQWIPGSLNPMPAVQWQIVGVFHTVKSRGAREDVPQIAVPFWQMGPGVAGIGVRTGPEPAAMIESISSAVSAVDSQAALALTRTMDQVRGETLSGDRLTMIPFASFAAVALSLAAEGVHGLTAFFVAQRSQEIALRMALGATRGRVVSSILLEGMAHACIGSAVGLAGACFVGGAMQSISFGVPAIDLLALIAAGLGLLLPALFACYRPAFRATMIEIMPALKKE